MTPERRREIEALNTARISAWCVRRDPSEQPILHGHGAAFLDCPVGHVRELLTELDRLQAELHSGHVLVPFDERYHRGLLRDPQRDPKGSLASSDRLGWLICTRDGCGYEVPSHGWCPEHMTLDACWAYEAYTTNESEETIDGSLREG